MDFGGSTAVGVLGSQLKVRYEGCGKRLGPLGARRGSDLRGSSNVRPMRRDSSAGLSAGAIVALRPAVFAGALP